MSADLEHEKEAARITREDDVELSDSSSDSVKDAALDYLNHHAVAQSFAQDPVRMAKLRSKIDRHIIPFLFCTYLVNYLDKVIINYAAVMGFNKDLKLKGNDFTNSATAFWAAVLIAAFPNVYLIQRLPTVKWLATCLFCWAIASASTAAVKNYHGLLAARVVCGAFESVVLPALMLITGQYYTRAEQVVRFCFWYFGTATGFLLGGLISWAFQHVSDSKGGLSSWQIMFVALGCITVVFAICIALFLPDTPMQARFLTEEEKISLLEHIKINMTGVKGRHFETGQLGEAILDPALWGLILIIFLQGIGGGVITTYSATLIKGFGYSPERSALLNMGSGAVLFVSICLCALAVNKFKYRWIVIASSSIPSIIGSAMMAWLPTTNKTGRLAGIYLVNTFVGSSPIVYQWLITNVAGHTKRAYGSMMLGAAFAVGNIVGPQTFQAKDAPEYSQAKETMVIAQSLVVVICTLLFLWYKHLNKKQDYDDDVTAEIGFSGRTDKENKIFRYAY